MKKSVVALVGILLSATAAQAEHKLLVTDILEPKQVEAQAKFEYARLKGDLNSPTEGDGKITSYALESNFSLGVGLLKGWEVTASVPYLLSEREKAQFNGAEARYGKRDGVGDFALETKYRVWGGEQVPWAMVAGLGLKFDTAGANNAGTGTTEVSPFLAASHRLDHEHTPYAVYRVTVRNHGENDTHTLTLGLEKELNHTVTLDAKVDANFNTSSDKRSRNQDFLFELSSYIQVAHNLYLLPSVSYALANSYTEKADEVRVSSLDGFRGGVSLYYLY